MLVKFCNENSLTSDENHSQSYNNLRYRLICFPQAKIAETPTTQAIKSNQNPRVITIYSREDRAGARARSILCKKKTTHYSNNRKIHSD